MKLTLLALAITFNICYAQKTIKTKMKDVEATIFVNKDYKSRPYKKIIVYSSITDGEDNKKILAELKEVAEVVNSVDLFPPIKKYTDEETKKIYQDNGIDGVLKVDFKGVEPYGTGRKATMDVTLTDLTTDQNAAVYNCISYLNVFNSPSDNYKTIVKVMKLLNEELKRLTI